jgi:hypothetical protein
MQCNTGKQLQIWISSFLLLSILSAVPLTMIAATPSKTNSKQRQQETWAEFIQNHPKLTVEYRYPSLQQKPIQIANDGDEPTIKIPASTAVVLRVTDSLSSKNATEASTVNFVVLSDVKVKETVVIKAGTTAKAQVSAIDKAGFVGTAGKILISDFSTRSTDGTFIPLQGTISDQASSKVVISCALSLIVCPLFLLMKGRDAVVPAGTEKTVYTASDIEVKLPLPQEAQ